MFEFKDLKFKERKSEGGTDMGIQARHKFGNGYGISVIRGWHTYGGPEGLYELGVFGRDGDLVRTPLIKNDEVVGWLTPEDVTEYGRQVEALAPAPPMLALDTGPVL